MLFIQPLSDVWRRYLGMLFSMALKVGQPNLLCQNRLATVVLSVQINTDLPPSNGKNKHTARVIAFIFFERAFHVQTTTQPRWTPISSSLHL